MKKAAKLSIKESVSELNQLLLTSSSNSLCSSLTCNEEPVGLTSNANISQSSCATALSRQQAARGTSSPLLNLNSNQSATNVTFKMPSNLTPVENSELITLDIDTYRAILQELQDTKIMLHKLANLLKEDPASSFNDTSVTRESDETIQVAY